MPRIYGRQNQATNYSSALTTYSSPAPYTITTSPNEESTTNSVFSTQSSGNRRNNSAITLTSILLSAETLGATVVLSTNINPPPTSQPQTSTGLSSGSAAGVGIGAAILGALVALFASMIVYKKRNRKRVSVAGGSESRANGNKYVEKEGIAYDNKKNLIVDFDLDRLLPQPLDDNNMKAEVQKVFSAIDAHVESFYTDTATSNVPEPLGGNSDASELLTNPASRFFMLKRIICQTMLESISVDCPSDRSFLPAGFTSIARRLQAPNLNDHATTLCWSRLRTSFSYLVRSDSSTERNRLDQAMATVVEELAQDLEPFERSGQTEHRRQDLAAISRSSAALGKLVLSQPAAWKFEWAAPTGGVSHLVYFPAFFRLTDNKGSQEIPAHAVLQAKVMR